MGSAVDELNTPAAPVAVAYSADSGHTVLEVTGELDFYSCGRLRQALLDLAAAGRHSLIIDVTEVPFSDSSGLGVLVGGMKRARAAGGGVCIAGASGQILGVLQVTGLTRVFPLYATVAEALSAAGR